MTENKSFLDNVLARLNEGYPEGVPPTDYFALLALLMRSLSEEEVVTVAQAVLRSGDGSKPVTAAEIGGAIHLITAEEPDPEELNQVASRLASVGWPLAAPATGGVRVVVGS